ncbi:MAG: hypothetical protein JAZ03_00340 [Candidatus Thiodiazotropha taylori]|nr:hypothetical protein [Candidatus Thiodiazotropha taylori]MCG8030621.1 hypothetical protein [Candidatus Thiodiazotropha taylori]MCW4264892.1 hypothetical protein [Candidatus Thiodiazotropha endolucinida]MCW4332378.1 hypothetical protein [Candidatus Thiodiazotropha endolucinida]
MAFQDRVLVMTEIEQAAFYSPPDYILLSLRTGERMSILSESVAMAANDGEAYESLVPQINRECKFDG